MSIDFLPDLATEAPLWLALVTVGVNAIVGSLRASVDDEHHWDIVGMATFALLMGLGGGFIRDFLIGNLPAESLRTPWYLLTVLGAMVVVLVLGQWISRVALLMTLLQALAVGLFAVVGTAYALRADLPIVSALLVGVITAVGGGTLVSIMKGEIPQILLASSPNALVALFAAGVYAITQVWSSRAAAIAGIAAAIVGRYITDHLGLETRRATSPTAFLLTRSEKNDDFGDAD